MPCFKLLSIDSVVFCGMKREVIIVKRNDRRNKRKRVQAEAPLLAQVGQRESAQRGAHGQRHD